MPCLLDIIDKIIKELKIICNRDSEENPFKNIIELINASKSDEQLAKMSPSWNPWF